MTRRQTPVADELDELMRTRKIAPRIAPGDDLHPIVQDLRQWQLDDHERIKVLWHHVRAMRPAKDWTETGIWEAMALRMQKQRLKIGGRLAWLILTGVGSLILVFVTWVASHLAWKTT